MNPMQAWHQILSNPFSTGAKKVFYEILGQKYGKHESVIENITENVANEKQYQEFGKLILDVYEAGFFKAIEQHKAALEQYGLKANIVAK